MSEITTVGIDLAKNVLSVYGVDTHGKTVRRKGLSRNKLLELMAQLPACRVDIEARSGAHELARTLQALGHDARITAPMLPAQLKRGRALTAALYISQALRSRAPAARW